MRLCIYLHESLLAHVATHATLNCMVQLAAELFDYHYRDFFYTLSNETRPKRLKNWKLNRLVKRIVETIKFLLR